MISSICGKPVCPLGLAAHPSQNPECIRRAFESGVNFFFFYGPGHKRFIEGLKPLLGRRRNEMILASGSGARKSTSLKAARHKILSAVGTETIDVFFAEYIHPGDDPDAVFGTGGVLDELQQWKADERIRSVGATTHDRKLATRLVKDSRVDLLMHRFNMAHRKAVREVFPVAMQTQTPIVAFTATRWGTLLKAPPDWCGEAPSAVDCYRYCLSDPSVHVVLTAPKSIQELNENLAIVHSPPMSDRDREQWERYGDLVYSRGGAEDDYESRWP